MKKIFTLILIIVSVWSTQAQITVTNTSDYWTQDQMLLSNEINESGEPLVGGKTEAYLII